MRRVRGASAYEGAVSLVFIEGSGPIEVAAGCCVGAFRWNGSLRRPGEVAGSGQHRCSIEAKLLGRCSSRCEMREDGLDGGD